MTKLLNLFKEKYENIENKISKLIYENKISMIFSAICFSFLMGFILFKYTNNIWLSIILSSISSNFLYISIGGFLDKYKVNSLNQIIINLNNFHYENFINNKENKQYISIDSLKNIFNNINYKLIARNYLKKVNNKNIDVLFLESELIEIFSKEYSLKMNLNNYNYIKQFIKNNIQLFFILIKNNDTEYKI